MKTNLYSAKGTHKMLHGPVTFDRTIAVGSLAGAAAEFERDTGIAPSKVEYIGTVSIPWEIRP